MKHYLQAYQFPILLFTIFIDLLGIGILIPVIPQLLANPTSSEYLFSPSLPLSTAYILYGFLAAAYPLALFLAAPILGQLSDRFGRKPILAISLFGTFIGYLTFAYAIATKNIPLLFLSRIFDGLTGGNISVAQAAIADITKPENRVKAFGLVGAIFGVGFILGPYIGGTLSDPSLVSWFSAATPFWFAALLSFFNALSVFFFFPETHLVKNPSLVIYWNKSFRHIAQVFALPSHIWLFVTLFLFQAGFAFYVSFFGVFLIDRFSFTQGDTGYYFAYVGMWIAFTQAIVTRIVARYYTEQAVLRVSLFATGIMVFILFFPTAWWQLLFITPFFAIFNGLTQANLLAVISRSAHQTGQGELMGISSSVSSLAQAIPPLIAGFVAARFSPETPTIVSFIIILFSGFVFVFRYRSSGGVRN
jgi:DHA1 family tetracycline resistance protein-like MFS transporter